MKRLIPLILLLVGLSASAGEALPIAVRATNGVARGVTLAGAVTNTAVGATKIIGTDAQSREVAAALSGLTWNGTTLASGVGDSFWFTNSAAASSISNAYNLSVSNLTGTGTLTFPTLNITTLNATTINGNGVGLTNLGAPGSTTQVLFNKAGVLGADAGLTYDDANDVLSILDVPMLRVQTSPRNYFSAGAGNLTATGSNNKGDGFGVFGLLTTGSNNTGEGQSAGTYLTTGMDNTYLGTSAGYFNSVGWDNTAIGTVSQLNIKSNGNTSIGKYTLFQVTNGVGNTVGGVETMYGNIHDDQIVDGAFPLNTTNWTFGTGWVSATGKASKNSDGTGILVNSFSYIDYGVAATYRIIYTVSDYTVGSVTASFGGVSDTARSSNGTFTWDVTPISFSPGGGLLRFTPTSTSRFSLTDISIVCISASAPLYNSVWGLGGLYMATIASENALVGQGVMRQGTTAFRNAGIGGEAMLQNGPGSYNSFLGHQAFYMGNTISNGVALGYQAGFYETNNNRLYIDNQKRASLPDAMVKSLAYGLFDADPANQFLTLNADFNVGTTFVVTNGNVGILKPVPAYPLDVVGIARVEGELKLTGLGRLAWGNGGYIEQNSPDSFSFTWFSGAPALATLTLDENNRLGVGAIQPSEKLDVEGAVRAVYGYKRPGIYTATAGFTLTATNDIVKLNAASATYTLPTAVGIQGKAYTLENIHATAATIARTSAQTIGGAAANYSIPQYQVISVISDNANWILNSVGSTTIGTGGSGGGTNRYYEAGEINHWVELGGTNGDPFLVKGANSSTTVSVWQIDNNGNFNGANLNMSGSVTLPSVFGAGLAIPYAISDVLGGVSGLTPGQSIRVDGAGTGFEAYTAGNLLTATATLNFGSILASASEDLTITVTGAAVGDAVHIGLPAAPQAGVTFMGFVSAADTVTIRAFNVGTIAADPASATYRAVVTHY